LQDLKNEDVFIIGGGEIYRQTIDLVDKLYITHVNKKVDGDVFFPKIASAKWKKINEEIHEGFSFVEYERIK
ncbi:MAG: dihydrofolate reductase, partial [Candidatus Aenigmatarchaeota archaeon]